MHIDGLAERHDGSCRIAANLLEPVCMASLNMYDALEDASISPRILQT